MLKVVSFGEILIDFLSNKLRSDEGDIEESFTKFPGGAPANVAAAVAKLGGESYFLGKLSNDVFGKFLEKSLLGMGVRTDYVVHTGCHKTALAFVSLDEAGERSFEFYRENTADMNFKTSDFHTELFNGNGIFHCCSNTLTEPEIFNVTLAGLKMAKKAGWLVSFDVNLRLNLWRDGGDGLNRILQCLKIADVVKLSKEELNFMANSNDEMDVINKLLSEGCILIIVTDGHNPLTYYMKDGKSILSPPLANTVDSTAAGDAFVGGFLYSLAVENIVPEKLVNMRVKSQDLMKYVKFASACGAFAVTKKGAFTALAEHGDLVKFFEEEN